MSEINLREATTQLEPTTPPDEVARAWLRAVILVGLGGYFGYNIWSGNLANYINERFVWLSYVAVGLFLALGGASAYRAASGGFKQNPYSLAKPRPLGWGVIGVAAIPLLLGVMVPSAPLGAEAVNGNISIRAVRGASTTEFSVPPEQRNVLDWLRSFNTTDDFEVFNGQPVDLIGFVYREPGFEENGFMVARFTLSCCVADASALGMPVLYEGAGGLTDGEWVRVRGALQVGEFAGDVLPIVRVREVTSVEQPEHPYLYP